MTKAKQPMLHSYNYSPRQTIHDIAKSIEVGTAAILQRAKNEIAELIKTEIKDLWLEEILGVLETIEERMDGKNISILTALAIITDLIKETIENHREQLAERLPKLEQITIEANVINKIAKFVADETDRAKRNVARHMLLPKQALVF